MTLTIRPVAADDRDNWSRLWDDYLAFYDTTRGTEVHDDTWARIMNPEQEMFSALAIDENGTAVGLVNYLLHRSFWDIEPRCYLNDLYVSPICRGKGAGRKMLEFVKAHTDELGVAKLYWLTAEDNKTARELYDRVAAKTPFIQYVM
ncbi:GNAT family N-acetyltransferase [Aliiroseovarius sp. KMU-50]|uniref:GNAT family N-acetyltransferase n=1 Tax=Aliiroseovarius salicola TaxID=3009082 RepID=A0ABT4W301_9RHOB|nr:GNAT family N-acetyltransferase [Aliiroseovarius sp. KMU-50]MDA5094360.1 GNAT family N-acetyltransferase [Aliiroseovarius sp. KMU-50]